MRVVLAALLLLPACKVITLGDSNTCFVDCASNRMWPERLAVLLPAWSPWQIVNRGEAGMMAMTPMDGDAPKRSYLTGRPLGAMWHLDQILATDLADPAPCRWYRLAPKLVLALGTNDVIAGRSPAEVVTDLLALRRRALDVVPCVQIYVALVPPQPQNLPSIQRAIAETNRMLRVLLPASRIIPFDQVDVGDIGPDGVHLTPNGQQHRAAVAFAALFPRCTARSR